MGLTGRKKLDRDYVYPINISVDRSLKKVLFQASRLFAWKNRTNLSDNEFYKQITTFTS